MKSLFIGEGGGGRIIAGDSYFLTIGVDLMNNRAVAIKVSTDKKGLKAEYDIMRLFEGIKGFPVPFSYSKGPDNGKDIMVCQLLGPNIRELLRICNGRFSLATTCQIGLKMVFIT